MDRQLPREAVNRRTWAAVRRLPGGEQRLREMVAEIHQADGTGQHLLGTPHETSTKQLSYAQLERLRTRVEAEAPRARRRRSARGDVAWFATQAEKRYVTFMARALGWSDDARQKFIQRQVKADQVKTHVQASAVIEPMERLMAGAGWHLIEDKSGRKWWSRPDG